MKAEYKIIADHLRSSCFLIADGVLPSNEGRGYVLRRIMRRSMLQLHKLGAKEALMHKFVDDLINEMKEAYSELVSARELIIETLKNEEIQFRKTLEKGLKILDEEIANLKNNKILSGKIAFKLYDTYGFPLDLTENILAEKNIKVDIKEFNLEMKQQKERARKNWKGSGEELENQDILKLQEELPETEFVGYEQLECNSKILCFLVDGKKQDKIKQSDKNKDIVVILDKTPFYATSGGQKGDEGVLTKSNQKIKIKVTTKIGDLFLHQIKDFDNEFNIGDHVHAEINHENRKNLAKNHSATHLMHKALKIILGNSVVQKGSNVDSKYFTFDFNLNRSISNEEIKEIENLVNFYITQNSTTKTELMELEKAKESGAQALFGEKYDNEVRVVSFGQNKDGSPYSVELCGGTHIAKTGEIEFFKIVSEKSIASGIRRIEAKTGVEAKNFVLEQFIKLQNELTDKIAKAKKLSAEISTFKNNKNSQTDNKNIIENYKIENSEFSIQSFDYEKIKNKTLELTEILNKTDQEIKTLTKNLENLQKQNLLKNLDELKFEEISQINFLSHNFKNIEAKDLREIANNIKNKNQNSILLLFATNQNKVSALINISENLTNRFDANILIKEVAKFIGAKGGGGKKDMAMTGGNDNSQLDSAIKKIKEIINNS